MHVKESLHRAHQNAFVVLDKPSILSHHRCAIWLFCIDDAEHAIVEPPVEREGLVTRFDCGEAILTDLSAGPVLVPQADILQRPD